MRHHMPIPQLIITKADYHDLFVLATTGGRTDAADDLFHKLERMHIVAAPRPEVVGMGSLVSYRPDNGVDKQVTLVMPANADISELRVSVLTPVGTALLGLSVGQTASWRARDGRDHLLQVLDVTQPNVDSQANRYGEDRVEA